MFHPHVCVHIAGLCEAPVTHVTNIWSLSGMFPHVFIQVELRSARFPAYTTNMNLQS